MFFKESQTVCEQFLHLNFNTKQLTIKRKFRPESYFRRAADYTSIRYRRFENRFEE